MVFILDLCFVQTTYTSCFLLHHLTRNPAVQKLVYDEAVRLMPQEEDRLDAKQLANNATYSRAVLKESLRLNPISVGVGRNLNTDLILGGYRVPKGVSEIKFPVQFVTECFTFSRRSQSPRI